MAPYRSRIKKVFFFLFLLPPPFAFLSVCEMKIHWGGKKEGKCGDGASMPSKTPIPNHVVRFHMCCEIIRGHKEGARFSVL